MQRLTTDNPQDNLESALNLFYVKDKWTWVRGYNPGPESEDISLNDLVRLIAEQHDMDMAQSKDDEEISDEMAYLLMDMTDTLEGVVALLYTAGWVCAELRAKLMKYEDTGFTPEEIAETKPRQGKWNGTGDRYTYLGIVCDVWECDQCGYIIYDGADDPEQLPKFCPNCGANMKGELK